MSTDWITPGQFHADETVGDWRVVEEGACAFYRSRSLIESAAFVASIAELPRAVDHPPDIDIRPDGVTIRSSTRAADGYGITAADAELARAVSSVAADRGLQPDPSRVQSLLIIPGAPNIAEITPFWRAVLDFDPRLDSPEEDAVDPRRRNPSFWFETMDEPRGDGGGAIHIAVWVPPEQAAARLKAALDAGGRLVRDHGPQWWTLADAYGNEADIATTEGRD
jgi:4a-hydroxytetrahydrobiopterin dehydratase